MPPLLPRLLAALSTGGVRRPFWLPLKRRTAPHWSPGTTWVSEIHQTLPRGFLHLLLASLSLAPGQGLSWGQGKLTGVSHCSKLSRTTSRYCAMLYTSVYCYNRPIFFYYYIFFTFSQSFPFLSFFYKTCEALKQLVQGEKCPHLFIY